MNIIKIQLKNEKQLSDMDKIYYFIYSVFYTADFLLGITSPKNLAVDLCEKIF